MVFDTYHRMRAQGTSWSGPSHTLYHCKHAPERRVCLYDESILWIWNSGAGTCSKKPRYHNGTKNAGAGPRVNLPSLSNRITWMWTLIKIFLLRPLEVNIVHYRTPLPPQYPSVEDKCGTYYFNNTVFQPIKMYWNNYFKAWAAIYKGEIYHIYMYVTSYYRFYSIYVNSSHFLSK